jgi:hypothetical protein
MLPRQVLQLFLIAAPFMFCPVSAQTSLQPPPIIPYGLPITIENAKLAAAGVMPNAGGIPIVVNGKLIGAIGVSGGSVDQDAQVAQRGSAR